MTYKLSKIFPIFTIMLFLGVGIAPIFNATVYRDENIEDSDGNVNNSQIQYTSTDVPDKDQTSFNNIQIKKHKKNNKCLNSTNDINHCKRPAGGVPHFDKFWLDEREDIDLFTMLEEKENFTKEKNLLNRFSRINNSIKNRQIQSYRGKNKPSKNLTIYGYVNDSKTKLPIENASLLLLWWDIYFNSFKSEIDTNETGFYTFNVSAIFGIVTCNANGYLSESSWFWEEETILWINFSLDSRPPENSIVCGFITDASTGESIGNVSVKLTWRDNQGHYYYNYTYSCTCGFYFMNVASGKIRLNVYADEYFSNSTDYYNISENETLWLNVKMIPHPPENSCVQGFITNAVTRDPIANATIELYWNDNKGHYNWNYTFSNTSGFYKINTAAGKIQLDVYADEYFYNYTYYYNISKNDTLWINVSLDPYPPENCIVCGYITNLLTGGPVENGTVEIYWRDNQGNYIWNYTNSSDSGFYLINTAAGKIQLDVYAGGYYSNYTGWFNISENETLWINISLFPYPPENSIVCGFITNSLTITNYLPGDPIEDTSVDLYWRDNYNHSDWNDTYSDDTGFYLISVAAGKVKVNVYADRFYKNNSNWFNISENETLWLNLTMIPYPPENSVVQGFITNSITGDSIKNASIHLDWRDNQGHYDWNYTNCNTSGFYQMNVSAGEIKLNVYADGYFSTSSKYYKISNNEILWINVSLDPCPLENSIVCGYITDYFTNDSIEGADVNLRWKDNLGNYYYNDTYSKKSGFYKMNIAAGEIRLYVYAKGYFNEYIDYFIIKENETVWINISLFPQPEETSIVCGYINDSINGDPIINASIDLNWRDNQGHYDWNYTYCNTSGFYQMNVAAGTIYLHVSTWGYFYEYTDNFNISDNETLWINVSLDPHPPKNSTVCGYITDSSTYNPINNSQIKLYWKDNKGHYLTNYTYSNSSGFYTVNTASGTIHLRVEADRFFREYTSYYNISENETLWINVSLDPCPPENSIVCGYITDSSSGDPIKDADVNLYWKDDQGHNYHNDTYSNISGFYLMNVTAGKIRLYVYAQGYFNEYIDYFFIKENETVWINISLFPRPKENSNVCGYINDSINGDPITYAKVELYWRDNHGHHDWIYTKSNASGYFKMNVASGKIKLYIYARGYFYEYTDNINISENETLWINVSLDPHPSENSIVCGYITDSITGDPIKNTEVDLYWRDNQGHHEWNDTNGSESGFYFMRVAVGKIQLDVYADGYFYNYTNWYNISENETLWINISLDPRPPENSIVCGYITDSTTGDLIEGADVNLRWKDNQSHYYYNDTYSNKSGFYQMNVAAGTIRLYVYAQGYYNEYLDYFNISDNETSWVNISLFPQPQETSVVCGYITDSINGNPIKNASIDLDWRDNQGHYDWNDTQSSNSGFYLIKVAAGNVRVSVNAEGYFNNYTDWYFILENEILWINISLLPNLTNYPPTIPYINGSINGTAGKKYYYTFKARDLDGDNILFFIDWGDNNTEWTEYNESGKAIIVDHVWKKKGTYTITAKAIDIHGAESKWGTLRISMPFSHQLYQSETTQLTQKSVNMATTSQKEF
jgi:hypothetical protein